jgi:hypothetical protein
MQLKRFKGITGTTGIKTTSVAKQWTYKVFVKLYQIYEDGLHRDIIFSHCLCKEALNCTKGTLSASFLANTTISSTPSCCWCILKLSLIARLRTLRSTALRIFFLEIANPKRENPSSFSITNSVKYLSVNFKGLENTFLYSAGFRSLNRGGKPKHSPVNLYG